MVDPGWFPDPVDPQLERYWDGSAWSGESRAREADGETDAAARPGRPAARGSSPWSAPWSGEAPRSTPAPLQSPHIVVPATPRSNRAKVAFGVIAALVLVGAAVAGWFVYRAAVEDGNFARSGVVATDGDEDAKAPADDVIAALGSDGVTCAEPGPAVSKADVRTAIADAAARFGDNGDLSAAEAAAAAKERVVALPDGDYLVRTCGTSLVVIGGASARLALFLGAPADTVHSVSDLGVPVVSAAAPSMTDTVARVESGGETCPGAPRTASKQVLLAELIPRLQAGGPDGAVAEAERVAFETLPDVDVTVRNCTHTRLIGFADTVTIALVGTGAALDADELQEDGPVLVVDA